LRTVSNKPSVTFRIVKLKELFFLGLNVTPSLNAAIPRLLRALISTNIEEEN